MPFLVNPFGHHPLQSQMPPTPPFYLHLVDCHPVPPHQHSSSPHPELYEIPQGDSTSSQGVIYHNHYYYHLVTDMAAASTKADKFALPAWNPKNMKWSEFFFKITMVLHKHKTEHSSFSSATDASNQEQAI